MKKRLITFCTIACVFSWTIWITPMISMNGKFQMDSWFYRFLVIGSFGPTFAGIITTYAFEGKAELIILLKKYFKFRFPFKYYLLSLLPFSIIAALIYYFIGIRTLDVSKNSLAYFTILLGVINGLLSGFLSGAGPLGEELGWRGYLLPELNKVKQSDLASSIKLGLIWAIWHVPLFLFPDFRVGLNINVFSLLYPLSLTLIAFIMTKIAKWTRGSVFIAIWFHGIINVTLSYMTSEKLWNLSGNSPLQQYLIVLLILFVGCIVYNYIDNKVAKSFAPI